VSAQLPSHRAAPVAMAPAPSPVELDEPTSDVVVDEDKPWIVIVWNDPINLMQYVTFVFQKLFGYSKEKAHKLMLDVHLKGKAVVSTGSRDKAELDVFRLHEHGLWATMQQD
jgi:ATP-dependent Clp protease adaptor protein ClpS